MDKEATTDLPFKQYQSTRHGGPLDLIVGSTGVEPRHFKNVNCSPVPNAAEWVAEESIGCDPKGLNGTRAEHLMFIDDRDADNPRHYRQITARNSPTIINSGFSDRLFHDGRAESTFNGFSIFGDRDHREVIYRSQPLTDSGGRLRLDDDELPLYGSPVPVRIALTKAALASQAVGPIVNDVEMSYTGRTFPHVACRMLDKNILEFQHVSPMDSHLGQLVQRYEHVEAASSGEKCGRGIKLTYRELIQKAFRREWWDVATREYDKIAEVANQSEADREDYKDQIRNRVPLELVSNGFAGAEHADETVYQGTLMQANFPLYWGLSIMMYESSLVSNDAPFDDMMRGQSALVERRWQEVKHIVGTVRLDRSPSFVAPESVTGSAVFQHGFRTFMRSGCIECHEGPLFSEISDRLPEDEIHGINALLTRTLLTNSRGDAIAIEKAAEHETLIHNVVEALTRTATPELTKGQAEQLARQLDLLREESRGDRAKLTQLVVQRLKPLKREQHADSICTHLCDFEDNVAKQFGERKFFDEEERMQYVGELVEPVFVEGMGIPDNQLRHRPKLPFNGVHTRFPTAFYDLGFYAIGVAPPRYDRGNGDVDGLMSIEAAAEAIQDSPEQMANFSDQQRTIVKNIAESRTGTLDPDIKATDKAIVINALNRFRVDSFGDDSSAARGQAYRFDSDWGKPQVRSVRDRLETPRSLNKSNLQTEAAESGGTTTKNFDCRNAVPPVDETLLKSKATDHSWDRNILDPKRRRADLLFRSRARTLVTDEDPTGFRKPFLDDNELAFWGVFRTPTLRNVELTAPYMHNGRLMTLPDVIAFYDRGGDIKADRNINPDMHPLMRDIGFLAPYDKVALHFFLLCLTDENVRYERAPFDHPSLHIVNGYQDAMDANGKHLEQIMTIDCVGRDGNKSEKQEDYQEYLNVDEDLQQQTPKHATEKTLQLFPLGSGEETKVEE